MICPYCGQKVVPDTRMSDSFYEGFCVNCDTRIAAFDPGFSITQESTLFTGEQFRALIDKFQQEGRM